MLFTRALLFMALLAFHGVSSLQEVVLAEEDDFSLINDMLPASAPPAGDAAKDNAIIDKVSDHAVQKALRVLALDGEVANEPKDKMLPRFRQRSNDFQSMNYQDSDVVYRLKRGGFVPKYHPTEFRFAQKVGAAEDKYGNIYVANPETRTEDRFKMGTFDVKADAQAAGKKGAAKQQPMGPTSFLEEFQSIK
jgi:hypothetical protein